MTGVGAWLTVAALIRAYTFLRSVRHIDLTDHTIPIAAGLNAEGQPVLEQVAVVPVEQPANVFAENSAEASENAAEFCVERTPAFVKGLARGDTIRFDVGSNSFFILRHSGNLAVRVFAREDMPLLLKDLVPAVEKLGGALDFANDRLLVFSLHVSLGFKAIEALFNEHIDEDVGQMWLYGNVYDPEDGQTPLNWWIPLLEET